MFDFPACGCHIHGSLNQSCDAISGQCYCKEGVVGLRCNRCLVRFDALSCPLKGEAFSHDSGCMQQYLETNET